jgi:ATP-dependent Clp protease protease subunit
MPNKRKLGFDVRNIAESNNSADLYIYGEIVEDKYYKTDVTPLEIADSLSVLEGVKNINLYINSPGGGVFAGMAIYSILERYKENSRITAYIDGVAGSITSVIVMVAHEIVMPSNTMIMIHDPMVGLGGYYNADELLSIAANLEPIKETIINVYRKNFTISDSEISSLMSLETFMTAQKCLEYGLIDKIADEKEITVTESPENKHVKIINGVLFDTKNFQEFPNVKNSSSIENNQPASVDYSLYENQISLNENSIKLL